MIERIVYVWRVIKLVGLMAWRNHGSTLTYSCAVDRYGVPQLTVVVGQGREAWRVSTFAIDALKRWSV